MSSTTQLMQDIPDYGSAFVCGKSRFEEGKFHVRDDPITEIACGDEHTGVVTEKGRVFMFGSNNWGQLGLGHENNVDRPSCIKSIKHEKVILIACGRNHTILATAKGNLYSFGCNSESQLGLGDEKMDPFYNTPQKIDSIEPQEWAMISAGSGHSFALSKSGELYSWGINDSGELGLERTKEQSTPKRINLDFKVSFVSCGYYHTAILSKKGRLYTCGSNEFYQLGRNSDDTRKFNEVDSINEPLKFVSCGGAHTVVVTASGRALSFGDGSKGQLGNGEEVQKSKKPATIEELDRIKIDRVSSGECHTAFVTEKGEIYACGDNRYGKLGLNQKTYNSIQFTPVIVEKYKQLKIEKISCGGCHMILIGKPGESNNYSEEENYRSKDLRSKKENNSRLSNQDSHRSSRTRRRSDSGTDVDEEAERTFNKTHTLTKENNFIPLSELNLKKRAAADEGKPLSNRNKTDRYEQNSPRPNSKPFFAEQRSDSRPKAFQGSRSQNIRERSDSESDSRQNKSYPANKARQLTRNESRSPSPLLPSKSFKKPVRPTVKRDDSEDSFERIMKNNDKPSLKPIKSYSDDENKRGTNLSNSLKLRSLNVKNEENRKLESIRPSKSNIPPRFSRPKEDEDDDDDDDDEDDNRNRFRSSYRNEKEKSTRNDTKNDSKSSTKNSEKTKEKKFKICTIL